MSSMEPTPQIKKYSFENIFNEHADQPDRIDRRLAKGYLSRREVTELLDHIQPDSNLVLESAKTSEFKWKIGEEVLNTNEKTNNIPFWMRRISHWFNLTFSSTYKAEFESKIAKVHQAFEAFKGQQVDPTASPQNPASVLPQNPASVLPQNPASVLPQNRVLTEAEAQALAEAEAQALAEAEARALEELQVNISVKKDEISDIQTQLNEIEEALTELNGTKEELEAWSQEATQKAQELTNTHTALETLNSRLNTYFLKGAYLEEEDKPIVNALEKAIYGENNSAGQLRAPENRTTQLQALATERDVQSQRTRDMAADLIPIRESIRAKTLDLNDMKSLLTLREFERDELIAQLPPSTDADAGNA